ncbi:hypothetical protein MRX96_024318 [Rhipicephalus microplus]
MRALSETVARCCACHEVDDGSRSLPPLLPRVCEWLRARPPLCVPSSRRNPCSPMERRSTLQGSVWCPSRILLFSGSLWREASIQFFRIGLRKSVDDPASRHIQWDPDEKFCPQ